MLFGGQINNPGPNRDTLNIVGDGRGADLWITANTTWFNSALIISPAVPGAGSGVEGYILHLAETGRMDNVTTLKLSTPECFLGLQDNAGGVYAMHIDAYGGNIFADRSYQLNDLNATVNVLQNQSNILTVHGFVNFGMAGGQFGRTNNGFGIHGNRWIGRKRPNFRITVNNGNLTEGRGGSRFVSGANRLQEAHNYTYVGDCFECPTPFRHS